MVEGLDQGDSGGSDGEKDALSKSNRLLKSVGATRIRDLSAIGLLSIGSLFYYGSTELYSFVEGRIKASPAIYGEGGLKDRIRDLERTALEQKEINQKFETRHSAEEAALRTGKALK